MNSFCCSRCHQSILSEKGIKRVVRAPSSSWSDMCEMMFCDHGGNVHLNPSIVFIVEENNDQSKTGILRSEGIGFLRLVSFLFHPDDIATTVSLKDSILICSLCGNRLGRSLNDCQEGKIIPNFAYEVFKDKLSINHHPLYSPLRRFLFTLLDIYLSKYCLWLKLILDLFFVSI